MATHLIFRQFSTALCLFFFCSLRFCASFYKSFHNSYVSVLKNVDLITLQDTKNLAELSYYFFVLVPFMVKLHT